VPSGFGELLEPTLKDMFKEEYDNVSQALYIRQDGTGNALYINQSGGIERREVVPKTLQERIDEEVRKLK